MQENNNNFVAVLMCLPLYFFDVMDITCFLPLGTLGHTPGSVKIVHDLCFAFHDDFYRAFYLYRLYLLKWYWRNCIKHGAHR